MGFLFFYFFPFPVYPYRRVTPSNQNLGDGVYSVSTCKQGAIEGVVIATGVHILFEKAVHLVETTTIVELFQQVISICYFG